MTVDEIGSPAIANDRSRPKRRAARRNYPKELADLESRLELAVRILEHNCLSNDARTDLIILAVKTLKGE